MRSPNSDEYAPARDAATAAVAAAARVREAAAVAGERVALLRAVRARLARTSDPAAGDALAAADAEIAAAEADRTRADAAARTTAAQQSAALSSYAALADPLAGGRAAAALSDQFPVLLAPLRLETRFTATELLVRVFPDDWAIDAFEPRPARLEVEAAQRHLAARWLAGRVRGEQLAAWRDLVASTGPGRAAWLVENFPAGNPDDEPRKIRAQRILVVAAEDPPPAAEHQPATVYWTAVWLAGGDAAALRAADETLVAAVGALRAAAIRARRPAGLDGPAPALAEDVIVAFLHLPQSNVETRPASWTRAARARLLPDQLALLGYADSGRQVLAQTGAPIPDSLVVSPDPALPDSEQLRVENGQLRVPEDLRWLVDFDRAVEQGMGFRVPLTDETRDGLDRLVVLGLRTRSTPQEAGTELETLLAHHFYGSTGLRVVPQGTPTNNTAEAPSGHEQRDVAEESFEALFRPHPNVPLEMWQRKRADRILAELLGLSPQTFFPVPGSEATDQREARAMNVALWPATWGYHLKTTLWPMFGGSAGRAAVDAVRDFFLRYVSGCGYLPAIQIGRQPYGILPTTAFAQLSWPDEPAEHAAVRRGLHRVLTVARTDWQDFVAQLPRVGRAGDPHQLLLDILGLHPASAEFHQRYVHSVHDYYNRFYLGGDGDRVLRALDQLGHQRVQNLLARLGYDAPTDTRFRLVTGRQHPLIGPLIDDVPLSETDPVRPSTADGRNYLQWLADRGRTALESVRLESGYTSDRPPRTLLYLLLRHALMLSFHDSGLRMLSRIAGQESTMDDERRELPFVHVTPTARASESRFRPLYSPAPDVTGDPNLLLVERIHHLIGSHPDAAELAEQIEAIELLADVPTARLERAMTQHLDCCTYRLDAWWLGLANERLVEQRYRPDFAGYRRGIHLGAYGWLEDVRPRAAAPQPVTLTGELARVFTPPGSTPLLAAPDSDGYLHTPSLNHAATAAILRTGYLSDATPANPGTLAVDLSSERVRAALSFLDGVRGGQSLGALLGYQLERGLHDRHAVSEVDRFIALLRGAFPLRAGRLPDTGPEPGTPIEAVEARNVVDGLALVRHVTRTGQRAYPFGKPLPTDNASPEQLAAVNAEVERLVQINDSIADLAVAESVHQLVLGNMERAAATLDAYSKAGALGSVLPPEPAVVQTPRSATTLTHRVGLHLEAGQSPASSPVPGIAMTPRAGADPALNAWLSGLLPRPADVGCRVTWTDPVTGADREQVVTQADLGLQPIDLLWTVRPAADGAMPDLDDRIADEVRRAERPRPDTALTIRHTERIYGGTTTYFQLSALLAALRSLLVPARPLRPSDLVPPATAGPVDPALDGSIDLPRIRPATIREELRAFSAPLREFLDDLGPLVADPAANRDALLAGVDTFVTRLADLLTTASGFGLVRGGWTELATRHRTAYSGILAAVAEIAARMNATLTTVDTRLAQYDALRPETAQPQRFRLLQRIERQLTTEPASPPPATPGELRAVVGQRRLEYADRLAALTAIGRTAHPTLSGLFSAVGDLQPLTRFDPTGLDLTPYGDRIVELCTDLVNRADGVGREVATRLDAADAALSAYDAATDGPGRADTATEAIHALLGTDAVATTEFAVPENLATEWRLVVDAAEAGRLPATSTATFPSTTGCTAWPGCATGCGCGNGSPCSATSTPPCCRRSSRTGMATRGWGWNCRRGMPSTAITCSTPRTTRRPCGPPARSAASCSTSGPRRSRPGRRRPGSPSTSTGRAPNHRSRCCSSRRRRAQGRGDGTTSSPPSTRPSIWPRPARWSRRTSTAPRTRTCCRPP